MPARTSRESGSTRWEIVIVMVIIVALVALAIPNLLQPRRSLNSCMDRNLAQIEAAKKQWAVELKLDQTGTDEFKKRLESMAATSASQRAPCGAG